MTEKLTINLSDQDVKVDHTAKGNIKYTAHCPFCKEQIILSRIDSCICSCDIDWVVEVRIKGKRAYTDDDKFQMPIPSLEVKNLNET